METRARRCLHVTRGLGRMDRLPNGSAHEPTPGGRDEHAISHQAGIPARPVNLTTIGSLRWRPNLARVQRAGGRARSREQLLARTSRGCGSKVICGWRCRWSSAASGHRCQVCYAQAELAKHCAHRARGQHASLPGVGERVSLASWRPSGGCPAAGRRRRDRPHDQRWVGWHLAEQDRCPDNGGFRVSGRKMFAARRPSPTCSSPWRPTTTRRRGRPSS